jgi:hypothetical protein
MNQTAAAGPAEAKEGSRPVAGNPQWPQKLLTTCMIHFEALRARATRYSETRI